MKNYYQMLGISPYSDFSIIQRALVKAAEQQKLNLEELTEIKTVLLNPESKEQYDIIYKKNFQPSYSEKQNLSYQLNTIESKLDISMNYGSALSIRFKSLLDSKLRTELATYKKLLERATNDGKLTEAEMIELQKYSHLPVSIWHRKKLLNKALNKVCGKNLITDEDVINFKRLVSFLGININSTQARMLWLKIIKGRLATNQITAGMVSTDVFLNQNEFAGFEIEASLISTQTHREYISGSKGISVKVAKGVWIRGGGSKGRSVNVSSDIISATGKLIITNQRIIFSSPQQSFSEPASRLMDLHHDNENLVLSITGRKMPYRIMLSTDAMDTAITAIYWMKKNA